MNKIFTSIVACLLLCQLQAEACTSIIVSGKVTSDGRPFIFKNRDTEGTDNLVVQAQGKRFRYIAIVSARDTLALNAWSGHNEAGFAIANTAAYNLNGRPQRPESGTRTGRPRENDASIMSTALGQCTTLADFEHLLDSLKAKGSLYANSNYAVLDAQGGVAYYETGNKGYVKFDANDPVQAPYGYLVRTNHGMSGDRSMDKGIERYLAISDYASRAAFAGQLHYEDIIRKATRYLTHGLTRLNLWDFAPEDDSQPVYFPFRDFIPRYQTASAHLIQGVKAGESPRLTVSWVIPGSTLTTVAIPLWITDKGELPSVVTRGKDGRAWLVDAGFQLKDQLFPIKRGNGIDYINLARLINKRGTGILQLTVPIEDEIFRRGKEVLQTVRSNGKVGRETTEFYFWANQYIKEQYNKRFNITL